MVTDHLLNASQVVDDYVACEMYQALLLWLSEL